MNRTTKTYETRPKWARPLSRKQWYLLGQCQGTDRPALYKFKMDVEEQTAKNRPCYECKDAWNTVNA